MVIDSLYFSLHTDFMKNFLKTSLVYRLLLTLPSYGFYEEFYEDFTSL